MKRNNLSSAVISFEDAFLTDDRNINFRNKAIVQEQDGRYVLSNFIFKQTEVYKALVDGTLTVEQLIKKSKIEGYVPINKLKFVKGWD